jgi:hypothetical protein
MALRSAHRALDRGGTSTRSGPSFERHLGPHKLGRGCGITRIGTVSEIDIASIDTVDASRFCFLAF